jgi:glycosyltransferase involved in cell wall biosynthesis
LVSRHFPVREGTATGRVLLATCEGLRTEGHEVDLWSWGPDPPTTDLPEWCRWWVMPAQPWLPKRVRALLQPRSEVTLGGWAPRPGSIPVADDPVSFPAVRPFQHSVLTQHYLTKLDTRAMRRFELRDVQDLRAERRNARQAGLVLAYSTRVANAIGVPATPIPIAYPVPTETLPLVDRPVATMLADWRWPPNRYALRRLLAVWPDVRDRVPDARLLIAGRHLDHSAVGTIPGVEVMGAVAHSTDVLGRSAVLAFPCPATSGPKVKVLEAMAFGVAVVTSPGGAEGIGDGPEPAPGLVSAAPDAFASELARVLGDPALRAELAAAGRAEVTRVHAPQAAARARVEACGKLVRLD